MKTNYFLIHGSFGDANYHWFGWLKRELEKKGFNCIVPEFETKVGVNNYESRKKILREYYDKGIINENTVFIGHSSGPIVVAKFLIEENINVKGIISVSGFNNVIGPFEDYNSVNKDFYISDEVLKTIIDSTKFVICFYSDNDPYLKLEDLENFALLTRAEKHFVKGAGHFNTDAGYDTFPSMLKEIKLMEDGLSLMENDDLPI